MIIGIAGATASGKTTVAHMLVAELDAYRTKYSDILADIARERGLDHTDKATLQNIFLSEREIQGEDFVTKEMEERIRAIDAPHIIIEGNRRLVDVDTLKRIAARRNDHLLLLYIDASEETRFARYNKRMAEHNEDLITYETFLELEHNKAEDELTALRTIFEKEGTVINSDDKTPQEIFQKVLALL